MNLLYFPDGIEIAFLERLTPGSSAIDQSKRVGQPISIEYKMVHCLDQALFRT